MHSVNLEDDRLLHVIDLLLDHGADVNARARFDETPLHMAAYLQRAPIINKLRGRGGDVTIKTAEGKTPADIAKEFGRSANLPALQ